ncbi:MAG: DUF3301 domain-containing protein [Pseudomonadota bacterium]
MIEMIAVALLLGAGWLWFDSLRARESAVRAARHACAADGVLFLDDTVALAAFGLQRGDSGRLALRRVYRFEFSDTGNNRLDGSVTMLGARMQTLYLAPHGLDAPLPLHLVH